MNLLAKYLADLPFEIAGMQAPGDCHGQDRPEWANITPS